MLVTFTQHQRHVPHTPKKGRIHCIKISYPIKDSVKRMRKEVTGQEKIFMRGLVDEKLSDDKIKNTSDSRRENQRTLYLKIIHIGRLDAFMMCTLIPSIQPSPDSYSYEEKS